MLIEAANRNKAAAGEMLALVSVGGASCEELREMLRISEATTAVIKAAQTSAASLIAKMQRHGDGGACVLAETAGLTRRDARGQINTAEAIAEVPSVRDAVEQGHVSQANARRLAEAVKRTSAEAVEADVGLLAKAASLRPEQFAKEARRWAADRQDDGGEREYQRLRAKRKVHVWDSDDGTVQLHGVFDSVTGRRIGNRLKAEARRMYNTDKKHATGSGTERNKPGNGRSGGHGNRHRNTGNQRSGGRASERSSGQISERRTFEQCMADALDNLTSHTPDSTTTGADAGTGRPADSAVGTGGNASQLGDSTTQATQPTPKHRAVGAGQLGDSTTPDGGNRPPDGAVGTGQLGDSTTGSGACRNGGPGGGRLFADISVIAHVDNATGELIAELPDGERLPSAVLDELVCNARLTGLVYDTAGTPIWRAKSSRTATEGQRQSLLNRWGGCFHCAASPDMCQIHHIVPVSQGGATKIDNMVPVCWDCHNNIHHHRWQVRKRPDGQHSLHPPDSTHYGPAHAPEQSLLFTQADPDSPHPRRRGIACRGV